MEKSFSFTKRFNNPDTHVLLDNWSICMNHYDDKKYFDAFKSLLKYIHSKLEIPEEGAFSLIIPHGSIWIEINADENIYSIKTPLLKIPESANLPILRQLLELNFNNLIISRVYVKDTECYFIFEDKMENCEPYKVYYVLEEMCSIGNYYYNFFLDKYNIEHLKKPKLNYFSTEVFNDSYNIFQSVLKETQDYYTYLEGKRFYSQCCDILAISIVRLDYIMAPQGILDIELRKILEEMYVSEPPQVIASKTKKKLEKLLEYDKSKFKESMYFPEFLINHKKRAELPLIQEELKDSYANSANNITSGAVMAATLSMTFSFYNLFYRYILPEAIENMIHSALSRSANASWENSANVLFDAMEKIMNQKKLNSSKNNVDINSTYTSTKNFFNKLFSIFK